MAGGWLFAWFRANGEVRLLLRDGLSEVKRISCASLSAPPPTHGPHQHSLLRDAPRSYPPDGGSTPNAPSPIPTESLRAIPSHSDNSPTTKFVVGLCSLRASETISPDADIQRRGQRGDSNSERLGMARSDSVGYPPAPERVAQSSYETFRVALSYSEPLRKIAPRRSSSWGFEISSPPPKSSPTGGRI